MEVTVEEYAAALKITNAYEAQLEVIRKENVSKMRSELAQYFKDNLVCGLTIEEYVIGENIYPRGLYCEIFPITPFFDEDYSDEKADADIKAIGEKHGMLLSFDSGIYGK